MWPSLATGAFRTPTARGGKKKTSQGRKKILKSSVLGTTRYCSHVHLYQASFGGASQKPHTQASYSHSHTWDNIELPQRGSQPSLIALYSQRNLFLTSSQLNKNSGSIINKCSMGLQPEISKKCSLPVLILSHSFIKDTSSDHCSSTKCALQMSLDISITDSMEILI